MIEALTKLTDRLPRLSFAARAAVLGGLVLAMLLLSAPVAIWQSGLAGLLTASMAAAMCLVAGGGALVICKLFAGPETALYGVVGGMLFRMALPLALLAAVYSRGGVLVDCGLAYYLMAFYLVTLLAETVMVLPVAERGPTR